MEGERTPETRTGSGHQLLEQMLYEVKRTIVGQDDLLERMVVALLARGHLLVEGVPGLAKTLAIKTLAQAIGGEFQRIQFTPDLVPADLVGTRIYNQRDGEFQVSLGPVFANLVLADEINRAPAKVQSALLEVMQERQVTIGRETYPAPDPFLVMATQNPIESEGTYQLPEAQVDRFMLKVLIGYPSAAEEFVVVERQDRRPAAPQRVLDPDTLREYQRAGRRGLHGPVDHRVCRPARTATRDPAGVGRAELARFVTYGASPRASINLVLAARALAFLRGRDYTLPDDVRDLARDVLRHRIVLSYEALAEDLSADDLLLPIIDGGPATRRAPPTSPSIMDHDRHADAGAAAAAARVAGRPAAGRPAPGRLPQPVPRRWGSTSPTCASTSPATTCATSSGTSPRGWTRPTSASTSRTARSRRGCCSTIPRRWASGRSTGRRTSSSPSWRRRSPTCSLAAAAGSGRSSSTRTCGRIIPPASGAHPGPAHRAAPGPATAARSPRTGSARTSAALFRAASPALARRRARSSSSSPTSSAPRAGSAHSALLARRHEVVALQVSDPRESELPDVGSIYVEDAETGEQIFVDTSDAGFRQRLRAAADERQAALEGETRRAGVDLHQREHRRGPGPSLVRISALRRRRRR